MYLQDFKNSQDRFSYRILPLPQSVEEPQPDGFKVVFMSETLTKSVDPECGCDKIERRVMVIRRKKFSLNNPTDMGQNGGDRGDRKGKKRKVECMNGDERNEGCWSEVKVETNRKEKMLVEELGNDDTTLKNDFLKISKEVNKDKKNSLKQESEGKTETKVKKEMTYQTSKKRRLNNQGSTEVKVKVEVNKALALEQLQERLRDINGDINILALCFLILSENSFLLSSALTYKIKNRHFTKITYAMVDRELEHELTKNLPLIQQNTSDSYMLSDEGKNMIKKIGITLISGMIQKELKDLFKEKHI